MSATSLKKILKTPFHLSKTQVLHFSKLDETLQQQVARDFVTVLPGQGLLVVAGKDAGQFLQGQLSCDVTKIDGAHSSLGLHCTPQGRVITSFRLCQTDPEHYAMLVPIDVAPLLHKSLARYIVFSKASNDDRSAEHVVFGISGDSANGALKHQFGAIPETVNAQVNAGGAWCTRVPGDKPRYQLCLPTRQASEFWELASAACQPADSSAWSLQDMRSGLATITTQTTEMFIPQMLDFDRVDAINFNKGCYTGQEIIARAHYRGTVKRRLHHFICQTGLQPSTNQQLFLGDKPVGTLVNWVQPEPNTLEGLLVLQENIREPVHFFGADAASFTATPCHPTE